MTNEELFWKQVSFGPGVDDHFICKAREKDRPLTRHIAWVLVVGPIPLTSPVDVLCDEPRCVNPKHLKVGPPRCPFETLDSVTIPREARPYFEALRQLSEARGFPEDIYSWAGYACGLMLLERMVLQPNMDQEAFRKFRKQLETHEWDVGISVDDALALGRSLRTSTPKVTVPESGLRLVPLAPDVAALMPPPKGS